MIVRIAHICLHVRSLAESVAFYERLGFRPIFRFTRDGAPYGAYLEISPGNFLEFFEEPAGSGVQTGSLRHFCLETDDMDATVRQLDGAGIAHTELRRGCDDTWQIWLRDPDGNDFEIHAYSATSRQFVGGDVEVDW